ncbi:MAG: hypothetical protein Q4D04_15550, partial [Clostridia bacterium]|nr:hypothetical protein [Clostridia bacterium]
MIRKMMALVLSLMLTLCGVANAETMVGAWQIREEDWTPEQNPDATAAFVKAMEGMLGVEYEMIACLGSQVVQGVNYCVLCRTTVVAPDGETGYVLAYVYEDLTGSAEITDIVDIDFGAEAEDDLLGGWTVNMDDPALSANEDACGAYDRAMEGFVGVAYHPVAYLGNQVVAGNQYCVLCTGCVTAPDCEPFLALVYVYNDLEGNAEISDIVELGVGDASDADEPEAQNVEISDPFSQVETLEDAAEKTGFPLIVGDAPAEHPDMVIRVLADSMIEVLFVNAENETEEALDEAYRVRKGIGGEDISGDCTLCDNVEEITVNGCTVAPKGNGDA